jgi:hypothetical protein
MTRTAGGSLVQDVDAGDLEMSRSLEHLTVVRVHLSEAVFRGTRQVKRIE